MPKQPIKVLRIIARLNVGGPARQVSFLHNHLQGKEFEDFLVYGQLDEGEGDASQDLSHLDKCICLKSLVRPISPLQDLKSLFKVIRIISEVSPDIVHTHTAKAGLLGRLAGAYVNAIRRFKGRPRLKTIHTYHGHVLEGYFKGWVLSLIKFLEKWLWKRTDRIITLTPKLSSEIQSHLGLSDSNRVRIIPLGFHLDPFLSLSRKDHYVLSNGRRPKFWIGWVGRFAPIKRFDRFVEMAKALKEKGVDCGFVVAGDGALKKDYFELLKEESLEEDFLMLGWQSELSQIYSGIDILMNTSDNEGTSVAMIEALASGVIVFATDVGGSRELLEGIYLKGLYPKEELLETIGRVQVELEKGSRIQESDRKKIVGRYSDQRLLADLKQLYGEIA